MINIFNYRSLKLKNNYIILLTVIVLSGACIRLINFTQPLLEGSPSKQITTAMIAKNYYARGFKLLYPQADGFGDKPGYLPQEFYILPFIAALFYKLSGGTYEYILRFLSVISYILATIMLYKLVAYYFNKKIGLISAFCFSISPLSIYLGRAVHQEMLITFFNMATIYFFSRWVYDKKRYFGIISIFMFTIAVLLKIPNLYLLSPLLFIAFTKFGFGLVKELRLWFFLIVSFIPVLIFNYHQYLVRIAFPNTAMDNFKIEMILKYMKIYLSEKMFYKKVFEDMTTYTLTPIGFTLFLMGLLLKFKEKRQWVFYIWMISVIIFFLIMPAQSIQGYYQMHFLPIACIFIAQFLFYLNESDIYRHSIFGFGKNFTAAIFILIILAIVVRYVYPYYRVPDNFRYVVETGRAIDRLTEKDTLVIASMENSIGLLYYSNRKGWGLAINKEAVREEEVRLGEIYDPIVYNPIEYLEFLRSKGADYFASASMKEFMGHKEFSKYMFDNYKILLRTSNYIIFDIRDKQPKT